MRTASCPPTRGFSLVELSIVLVVIGLLTGGVLMGRSLIRASEIQSVLSDYQKYKDAVGYFLKEYQSLPGDMPDATEYWGAADGGTGKTNACTTTNSAGSVATCNGNGDGALNGEGVWGGNTTRFEVFRAWQQLVNAKFITGNFTGIPSGGTNILSVPGENIPASKVANAGFSFFYGGTVTGGASPWFDGTYGNAITFGTNCGGDITICPAITVEEAWNMDSKIDDGLPATGGVRPMRRGTYSSTCPNAGGTAYDLANSTTVGCALNFITGY